MGTSVTIKLTSKKDEAIKASEAAVILGLEMIGTEGEGFAKEECPVDTGRLRASITHATVKEELAAYIGTNVEYAPYVEYGEAKHENGKAHFLRDAAADHSERYKELMLMALQGNGGDE